MANPKEAVTPITPEELVRQLRALREQVPDFTLMSPEELRPLVRTSTLDIQLVHQSINAIAASTPLEQSLGRSAESLRLETELAARWSQALVEIDAFRLGVSGAITIMRHRVGSAAFKAYQMSRQLARYKENANLLPHIDAMRRVAKFPTRAAQPQPEPTPGPQPEPLPRKQ
jgi:hypothetical protein